jgi:hypothetical protein
VFFKQKCKPKQSENFHIFWLFYLLESKWLVTVGSLCDSPRVGLQYLIGVHLIALVPFSSGRKNCLQGNFNGKGQLWGEIPTKRLAIFQNRFNHRSPLIFYKDVSALFMFSELQPCVISIRLKFAQRKQSRYVFIKN